MPPELKEYFFDERSMFKLLDVILEQIDDYKSIKMTLNRKLEKFLEITAKKVGCLRDLIQNTGILAMECLQIEKPKCFISKKHSNAMNV